MPGASQDPALDAHMVDEDFDLDVRIAPGYDQNPVTINASGDCDPPPPWTEEGSTCRPSCPETCGGTCTCPTDCHCENFE